MTESLWPWSVVEMTTNSEQWWREVREKWPVFSVRVYCDRSVLTLQMVPYLQYLLYLPRLGPDFVIFIVPRPGGHQAGLGWLTGRE